MENPHFFSILEVQESSDVGIELFWAGVPENGNSVYWHSSGSCNFEVLSHFIVARLDHDPQLISYFRNNGKKGIKIGVHFSKEDLPGVHELGKEEIVSIFETSEKYKESLPKVLKLLGMQD